MAKRKSSTQQRDSPSKQSKSTDTGAFDEGKVQLALSQLPAGLTTSLTNHLSMLPVEPVADIAQLLCETIRFLAIKAFDGDTELNVKYSPSFFVDQAWHVLMLHPRVYHSISMILTGNKSIIDHNPLGGADGGYQPRFEQTLARYEELFGVEPPALYWDNEFAQTLVPKDESGVEEGNPAGDEDVEAVAILGKGN